MPTFTIQRSDRTGDLYILEMDGDNAVRRHGPISAARLSALTPDDLHRVEFDDEGGDETWGVALEYRDGAWMTGES